MYLFFSPGPVSLRLHRWRSTCINGHYFGFPYIYIYRLLIIIFSFLLVRPSLGKTASTPSSLCGLSGVDLVLGSRDGLVSHIQLMRAMHSSDTVDGSATNRINKGSKPGQGELFLGVVYSHSKKEASLPLRMGGLCDTILLLPSCCQEARF